MFFFHHYTLAEDGIAHSPSAGSRAEGFLANGGSWFGASQVHRVNDLLDLYVSVELRSNRCRLTVRMHIMSDWRLVPERLHDICQSWKSTFFRYDQGCQSDKLICFYFYLKIHAQSIWLLVYAYYEIKILIFLIILYLSINHNIRFNVIYK